MCVSLVAANAEALELPELAAASKPSVVHLIVVDAAGREIGSGTGFFVEGDRVVTNAHVVSGADTVRANLSDGRKLAVRGALVIDEDKDIAILAVEGNDLPKPLTLGNSTSLRQGDEVVVLGSPRGLAGTLSTGIVSAIRGDGIEDPEGTRRHRAWEIQVTAAISPGSSGSPIMTRQGHVVAVAVGIVVGQGSLNFGVPIEYVKEMLAALPPGSKVTPFSEQSGGGMARNLIISAVFFGLIVLAFVVPGFIRRRKRKRS